MLHRIHAFVTALRRSIRLLQAFGAVTSTELKRVGLFDEKGPPSILAVMYRIYWWLLCVVVFVLPTWREEAIVYFPALLALSAGWLLALPAVTESVSKIEISNPNAGVAGWHVLIERLRRHSVEVPELSAQDEEELLTSLPALLHLLIATSLLDMVSRLSYRAVASGVVAIAGIVIGPPLASVHLWVGWSPVSVLYAMSAPWAMLLLASLILPVVLRAYVAARNLKDVPWNSSGDGSVPEVNLGTPQPSRRRRSTLDRDES